MADITKAEYINIETYRKDGTPVLTPVWFAASENGELYIYSVANSGKVKRIRNNPRVRIAPCTMRGKIRGEWVDAEAQIVDGAEVGFGQSLLGKKYFPWKQIGDFFSRRQGKVQAIIVIRIK